MAFEEITLAFLLFVIGLVLGNMYSRAKQILKFNDMFMKKIIDDYLEKKREKKEIIDETNIAE